MASSLVMGVVLFLGLAAFSFSVTAEVRRSKVQETTDMDQNYNYCQYGSDISTGFGVGALLCLGFGQALLMVGTKCFRSRRTSSPGGPRTCANLSFWTCWLAFSIAEMCLLVGTVQNSVHTRYRTVFFHDPPSCKAVQKGVFATGAAFALCSTIVGVFYYIFYDITLNESRSYASPSIVMSSF